MAAAICISAVSCVIHYESVHDDASVTRFTNLTFNKCMEYSKEWIKIDCDCESKCVAERFQSCVNEFEENESQSEFICENLNYHRECYQRFTNKTHLTRAMKRKENLKEKTVNDATCRVTRTQNKPVISSHGLFPKLCIICQKENLFCKNRNHTYTKAKLMKCESDSQSLLKAAESKGDERILLHIRGVDLAAAEVHYHFKCYRDYTRVVTGCPSVQPPLSSSDTSTTWFDKFCDEVITRELFQERKVLTCSSLFNSHINYAKQFGEEGYSKTQTLKTVLLEKFPDLKIFQRQHKYKSDLIYVYHHSLAKFIDNQTSDNESSYDEDEEIEESCQHDLASTRVSWSEMFMTGLHIRDQLDQQGQTFSSWPYKIAELTQERAKASIPIALFNTMAIMTGLSDEPDFDNYVKINDPLNEAKLISLCQDVQYLQSKGKKPTVKHVSLAMTVRHWTSSSKLINLLNGLGHCVSSKFALQYDTALANQELEKNSLVPEGFKKKQFTVLTFDNSDFQEETISGKGTTHCTSGIIIQLQSQTDLLDDNFDQSDVTAEGECINNSYKIDL